MNLKLVRAVDRWVGVPACWFLSGLYRIKSAVTGSARQARVPRNILLVQLSEMGSVVLAWPAIAYLKQRYPDCRLYFLIFAQNRPILDTLGAVDPDCVFTICTDGPLAFFRSTVAALSAIRAQRIDTVIDFELFARFSALLSGLCGAVCRVGFSRVNEEGLYRGTFLTHPVAYNCHRHMAVNFLTLAKAPEWSDLVPLVKAPPDEHLALPDSIGAADKRVLVPLGRYLDGLTACRHLVMFNPSAGNLLPIRAWPPERYVALAHRLLADTKLGIVVTGTADDVALARNIADQVASSRCVSLAGLTSMDQLLALLAKVDVLVTADGGPAHFATLTRTATVVLFGPETANLYKPLGEQVIALSAGLACSPCLSAYNHRRSPCRRAVCMEAIGVEAVLAAVSELLESQRSANKK